MTELPFFAREIIQDEVANTRNIEKIGKREIEKNFLKFLNKHL